MALKIVTIGGIDILAQMFNAIAAMTTNRSFFYLMGAAEILGVAACVFSYVKTRDIRRMGIWLLFFVFINGILLTPKVSLVFEDKIYTTKVKKVDNVPVGVALPFYLFSITGHSLAEMYDNFLSQPNDVQYNRTGMLFGQRLLERSFNLVSNDQDFEANMAQFTSSCIVPDIEINRKYNYKDVYNAKNLYAFFFSNPSFSHSKNRHVFYENKTVREYVTCFEGAKRLKRDIDKIIADANSASGSLSPVNRDKEKNRYSPNALAIPQGMMQSVYSYLMNTSANSVDIYKQNILVNSLRRNMDSLPASFDSSADMVAITAEQSLTKMRLANLSSYHVASRTLPALYTVFSALLVGIFPIIILAMFVTELTMSIVKSYMGFLFSLMLYPVLFAIFNSVVNTLTYQQMDGQAFTLSSANTLQANLSDLGATASYLMLSIPFISFGLIKGLGQAVSSAGSYLGNALASTTSSDAAQVSAGNYNFGNMQMQNVNGFKTDINSSFKSGMHTEQLANGAIENKMMDGSYSYNASASMSSLPFKVDWSKTISSSWNERSAFAIQEEARNSQGVRESVSKALSHIDGYHKGNTHTSLRANDVVDTNGYNKNTSISESTNYNNDNRASSSRSHNESNSENVSTKMDAGIGVSRIGKVGMDVSQGFGTTESFNKNKHYEELDSISRSLQDGTSLSKVDNLISQIKKGTTDSSYISVLNNIQNEVRNANERYNDYVETESKSLNNSKEAILSNTQNVSVTQSLDSALYKHIKENYTEDEQRKILNTAPDNEGLLLRNKAISEVSGKYIDGIVESHHSRVDSLNNMYGDKNLTQNATGNLTRESLSNQGSYGDEKKIIKGDVVAIEPRNMGEFKEEMNKMEEKRDKTFISSRRTQNSIEIDVNKHGNVGIPAVKIKDSIHSVADEIFVDKK